MKAHRKEAADPPDSFPAIPSRRRPTLANA